MEGKTCLVTGASDGIGYVAARELALKGASVIAVGRNAPKTHGAVCASSTKPETMMSAISSPTCHRERRPNGERPRENVPAGRTAEVAGAIFLSRRQH